MTKQALGTLGISLFCLAVVSGLGVAVSFSSSHTHKRIHFPVHEVVFVDVRLDEVRMVTWTEWSDGSTTQVSAEHPAEVYRRDGWYRSNGEVIGFGDRSSTTDHAWAVKVIQFRWNDKTREVRVYSSPDVRVCKHICHFEVAFRASQ